MGIEDIEPKLPPDAAAYFLKHLSKLVDDSLTYRSLYRFFEIYKIDEGWVVGIQPDHVKLLFPYFLDLMYYLNVCASSHNTNLDQGETE